MLADFIPPTIQESYRALYEFLCQGPLEERLLLLKSQHGIDFTMNEQFVVLNYSDLYVNWREPYGYICRGIVLDREDLSVVSCGLRKFFNLGEGFEDHIDWNTAKAYEKLDGSLLMRWWNRHTQTFCYTTRSMLPEQMQTRTVYRKAESACATSLPQKIVWADLVEQAAATWIAHDPNHPWLTDPDLTLVYELTSPYNKIVIHYDEVKITLLAVRHKKTLQEYSLTDAGNLPVVRELSAVHGHISDDKIQKEDFVRLASSFDGVKNEGLVVCDAQWRRVKIKNANYVYLHHMISNLHTEKNMILFLRIGEMSELYTYFPEIAAKMQVYQTVMEQKIADIEREYQKVRGIVEHKEFARAVQSNPVLQEASALVFRLRNAEQGIKFIGVSNIKEALHCSTDASFVNIIMQWMAQSSARRTLAADGTAEV